MRMIQVWFIHTYVLNLFILHSAKLNIMGYRVTYGRNYYALCACKWKPNSQIAHFTLHIHVFFTLWLKPDSPLQYGGLQVVDKVFSKVNHVSQCVQYQCIGVLISVCLRVVVLHKKDAFRWKTQLPTQLLHLNLKLHLRNGDKELIIRDIC